MLKESDMADFENPSFEGVIQMLFSKDWCNEYSVSGQASRGDGWCEEGEGENDGHHGIVMKSADGITRHVFPSISTCSADYPEEFDTEADEKLREASKHRVDNEVRETVAEARKLIYEKVENLSKPTSLVPTENAFSELLALLFQ
ncbi:hypothetical protein ARMGADRAFT_1039242 [Armillaria gallica]|uniref:Uncharacterized protein n=1 Tax=Armillaria gallica TaxID=47427 RepID=A0A2H3CI71_ARMGA|nr:hypothetical protein ARMGADRAFT_1039242 [Armillaria gallica]